MVDVSEGVNQVLGVSPDKLDEAIYRLEAEYGYQRYGVGIRQPTNINQQTNVMVIANLSTTRNMRMSIKVTFSLWVTTIRMMAVRHSRSSSVRPA